MDLAQSHIPLRPCRQPGHMVVVGRRGDRQHLADRLDPVRLAMIVDERDHGLNRRSSVIRRTGSTPIGALTH